jgi:5'(3')-deoxyribonucleotidase
MNRPSNEASGDRMVLVDMDGVLADYETPNDEIVRAFGLMPIQNRTEFYYVDAYREYPDLLSAIYEENRRQGFFRAFPLVRGAVEGWQRILNADFIPRVCSSPLENHPTVVAEKKQWLEEYIAPRFGRWVIDTAIFDRDKSSYDASAMIDDRPTLRGADRARWQQVVFTRSYNKVVETDFRLNGWGDPALETFLERCKERYCSRV